MERLEKNQQDPMQTEFLDKFGTDNKLDPVSGRDTEIERAIQILCKRKKCNPCLIGDPGVGKTVIVEGLASKIVAHSVPRKLLGKKIYALEMGRLIAGASNRGEFEERLIKVVDEVKQSQGVIILFIDELHTLVGAGGGGNALDAANILKPALARGELKCIGATTVDEYRTYIEKDGALKRRFQSVDVPEPSIPQATQILKMAIPKYELHHNVRYEEKALVAAVLLSNQFIRERFLPDKALDLIDEAGSRCHLQNRNVVTEADICNVVSMMTGIPLESVTAEESLRLLNMEEKLQGHIVGQDEAVRVVCKAVRRARSGFRDPTKPIASFLFTGPTGVGKTELANALALEFYGSKDAIIRVDMSEYMEKHTVSRLFGSPPGYVGYGDGGQLTESVRRRGHSLILFDEIEKAHNDVTNTLLQILDYGSMTDGKGRKVDFRNTIIIMTSNIGQQVALSGGISDEEMKLKVSKDLKESFRAELLNRIDEVVLFKALRNKQVKDIVEIMLRNVAERVKAAKGIEVEVSDSLKEKVIREGYNPSYGARPLKRSVVRLVEDQLADCFLEGKFKEGGYAYLDVINSMNS
ncbi:Chaperone protein ClpC2, chloroplastic [Linum perenne]